MILARAPLRISLAGGGTDLESYYGQHGGLVLSTSINKYFYVFLTPGRDDGVQISSSDFQMFTRRRRGESAAQDGLRLAKVILEDLGIEGGVSLFLASEVPPGTGLGSSSTVSVALIKALSAYQGRDLTPHQIADLACSIEIERLGAPIGRQDQYAAAFGGLNSIRFESTGTTVEPVHLPPSVRTELESNLLLFFTGATRSANTILAEQREASREGPAVTSLHAIKQLAVEARRLLEAGQLSDFGTLLDTSWQEKRRLAKGISNPRIDGLYELARSRGARGGKLAGAGGGGFLMLYCEPDAEGGVTQALEAEGLFRLDYRFENGGAMVLVNTDLGAWPRPVVGAAAGTLAPAAVRA